MASAPNKQNSIIGWSGGPWQNITFNNVTLGGKKIESAADFGKINEFATDIKFIK